ncbi:MAG: Crp/Fnr family transcriptional regulator [Bacteroidota bacterium]
MMHLCEFLVMKHFKKGEQIRLKNGNGCDVYFLKSGTVKIISLYDSGEEAIKYLVNEGEIFGVLGLTGGENDNDYAMAIEDSLICIIESSTLRKMMDNNSRLNNYLFKMAGMRIQKLERKLESLVYKDAETRITEFIDDYIKKFGALAGDAMVAKNILSNKDIGKLTSTSRQTVNKVLNEMKNKGILDFDKNIIQIKLKTHKR